MRLFLAIELPDPVRQHLADLTKDRRLENHVTSAWGDDFPISVTIPQNLHVTLKFLGEVDESAVGPLREALARVETAPPARVFVAHAELLPPRGPVRVVSVGLDGDVGRVAQLQRDVEAACAEHGFPAERRAYLPHVTLARARSPLPPDVRDGLQAYLDRLLPGPPFDVNGFALFESKLGAGPPRYTPVARFGSP
jgi:RNA 2',3'-cyclic 3'-phosphodiesterase